MPSDAFGRLIRSLADPRCFRHPAESIEVIQTHAACVLLTGEFAYKIKKPVDLGFLDFSTLEKRRACCEEELRLNRRIAPGVYLDVVPITGTVDRPIVGGPGAPIEYAVRMRQFPQHRLLDRMARAGALTEIDIDRLAATVAAFHGGAARADRGSLHGSAAEARSQALQNFEQMIEIAPAPEFRAGLEGLRAWTVGEHLRLAAFIDGRRDGGYVRECHGDLHLGNIAMIGGAPTPFDAIEFNPGFRWIDVISDVAFLFMDLHGHAMPAFASRFLNAWLEACGDYDGVALLRWYVVYRAMVRAKVACIRAHQQQCTCGRASGPMRDAQRHIDLAHRFARERRAALVLMHGPSGSGKTVVSQRLLEGSGAIRLRSDRERMRGAEDSPALPAQDVDAGRYAPQARTGVYAMLATHARRLAAEGYPVIVDATFQERAERDRFRDLARALRIPFAIASCRASAATLRTRVAERHARGRDASQADVRVLERQLEREQPLEGDEQPEAVSIDTEAGAGTTAAALAELVRRMSPQNVS